MKPAHERNQESLPPKKRDLPLNSSGGGDESTSTRSSGSTGSDAPGTSMAGEWMRVQTGLPYSVESSESMAVPIDQYGMLYKVALPSGTYSPNSLHQVLNMGHLSPAYSMPSPLLQHPGIPYPPMGYAQIPHSSLQFVGAPYAVPYAVPPGFVPSSLISPQTAIPQQHHVSHLVPYPSVIQEGVITPPPQPQSSAHAFTKMATAAGLSVVLASDHATQQHIGAVAGLSATEISPRGVPVYYHHASSRAPPTAVAAPVYRDVLSHHDQGLVATSQLERGKVVNGGEEEQGGRELLQELLYSGRNMQVLHVVASTAGGEGFVDGQHTTQRQPPHEERPSPSHRSTPDTDLEVQQVVGRLDSPNQNVLGNRKEASFGPLNLSQGSHRSRETLPAAQGRGAVREETVLPGRTAFVGHAAVQGDPRIQQQQQPHHQPPPQHHAVILANGQSVLVPLEQNQQFQQQQHPGLQNNITTTTTTAAVPKASEPPARTCTPERVVAAVDVSAQQQGQPVSVQAPVTPHPSHFMKGAIIQLANGELKRVEDLQTQDFVRSAEMSGSLKIDSSMQQQQQAQARTPTITANVSSAGVSQPMGPPASQQLRAPSQFRADRTHREREDEEEAMQVGVAGSGETALQTVRTFANQPRGQTNYYLHTESHPQAGGEQSYTTSAAQRRWSAPGFQRYGTRSEESAQPSSSSSGSSRPSFIPQEVKLSIEGRSNAGK
ncbi:Ataxin-1-like [Acipenser ruthenus]|uniref:Ataxin-1-like n=1 Tax=Acipenser ruthenus TaxID=7906 RepID=A0A444TWE7_ACIRT|nr:Ataxin-1-like [Acipenser ruthenus]